MCITSVSDVLDLESSVKGQNECSACREGKQDKLKMSKICSLSLQGGDLISSLQRK